jgi:hypothetical protein
MVRAIGTVMACFQASLLPSTVPVMSDEPIDPEVVPEKVDPSTWTITVIFCSPIGVTAVTS